MRVNQVIIMLLLVILMPASAFAYCIEDWACISTERASDGVTFTVTNRRPFPITVTLTVDTKNLRSDEADRSRYEVTEVLHQQGSRQLLKLQRVNPNKRFWYDEAFYWTPGDLNAQHADVSYLKPFAPGQRFPIVQGFGGRYSHSGASKFAVDFAMPVGTPVHAARGGIVIDFTEKYRRGGASRRYAPYANYIIVLHDDNTTGEYFHLKQFGVEVELGQRVEAGELIGYSGNTGFSSLPHLHFAVYRARPFGNFESLPFQFAD